MLEQLKFQIKNMSFLFFVPIIGYLFLFPIMTYILCANITDMQERYFYVASLCYQIVPILSVVYLFLCHKEYVEGVGREVLLMTKGICRMSLFFFFLNIPMISISFQIVSLLNGIDMTTLIVEMIIVSFFFNGVVFFLNFSISNVSLSALVIMLYVMLANIDLEHTFALTDGMENVEMIAYYFYTSLMGQPELLSMYGIVGVLFWLFGVLKARRIE